MNGKTIEQQKNKRNETYEPARTHSTAFHRGLKGEGHYSSEAADCLFQSADCLVSARELASLRLLIACRAPSGSPPNSTDLHPSTPITFFISYGAMRRKKTEVLARSRVRSR